MVKKISYFIFIMILFYFLSRIITQIPFRQCIAQLQTISLLWFPFILIYLFVLLLLDTSSCYLYLRSIQPLSFIRYLYIDTMNHLLELIVFPPIPDSILLTQQHRLHIPLSTSLCVLLWERYLNAIPQIGISFLPLLLLSKWMHVTHPTLYLPILSIVFGMILLFVLNAGLILLPQYAKGKFAWLMQAQDVLAHLWQQKKIMLYQFCIHLCYLILKHSVLIWCACMLQLPLSFEQAIFYFLLSILCDLLMMVIPMVGKHGIAEAVFLFLFASVFQDTTLFSMMLLWRICTFYAPVFFYLCLVGLLHVRIKQEHSDHFAAFVKLKRK